MPSIQTCSSRQFCSVVLNVNCNAKYSSLRHVFWASSWLIELVSIPTSAVSLALTSDCSFILKEKIFTKLVSYGQGILPSQIPYVCSFSLMAVLSLSTLAPRSMIICEFSALCLCNSVSSSCLASNRFSNWDILAVAAEFPAFVDSVPPARSCSFSTVTFKFSDFSLFTLSNSRLSVKTENNMFTCQSINSF